MSDDHRDACQGTGQERDAATIGKYQLQMQQLDLLVSQQLRQLRDRARFANHTSSRLEPRSADPQRVQSIVERLQGRVFRADDERRVAQLRQQAAHQYNVLFDAAVSVAI